MNRRSFLAALAASSLALSGRARPRRALAAKPKNPAPTRPGLNAYAVEAAWLNRALMKTFWDTKARMFRAPTAVAETVASDPLHNHGYVFWPSLLGLHALVEGERNHPGQYAPQIAEVYQGLEQYYDPAQHAYTAWLRFPGNQDSYYDDNAWAVITLVEAHNAVLHADPANAQMYLQRAGDIMAKYVYAGWDNTKHPGGMRWGFDPSKPGTSDRATSATAASALAALMLARAGVNASWNTRWGHDALTWLMTHLLDTDSLVMDALTPPDWKPRKIKYTYNTGVPIRAFVEHYRLTRSQDSLHQATRLAQAATNHQKALFDSLVHDANKRFYYDSTFFVHYLMDGLLQLALETADHHLAAALTAEARRNADYAYRQLRDTGDGLYWRNWRLWKIGSAQLKRWESLTGQTTKLDADPSERSLDPAYSSLPVNQRPLVKTLLANAGAARLYWLMSRFPRADKAPIG